MRLQIGILLLALALAPSPAAPASSPADAEIDGLLQALRTSNCRFQRNGTWYEAPQAADHLGKKRDSLAGKDRLHSAEDFIRLAGTESSMSGAAYRVACPGQQEVASKDWLEAALRRLRGRSAAP